MTDVTILRVAVPTPALDSFDYLPPPDATTAPPAPGIRVRVGFGARRLIGLVVGHGRESQVPLHRLRPVLKVLDSYPILDARDLELLCWASRYYHHPLGEVISAALPKRVRQGHAAARDGIILWRLSERGRQPGPGSMLRAPRQAALMALLGEHPEGLDSTQIETRLPNSRQPLAALEKKQLITKTSRPCLDVLDVEPVPAPSLNADQRAAIDVIVAGFGRFNPMVLDGVTGSGKTEVYLTAIAAAIEAGRQALLLVPEIALTPQLVARFRARFSGPLALMHSGLSDAQRHCAWHMARTGRAQIIVGTRSAVFTPLAAPGIIIVDEEHDGSFKQQEGFRYHARDLAVIRAHLWKIPVVLGSATVSLETLYNVERGKYRRVRLPARARRLSPPSLETVDVRRRQLSDGFSPLVLEQVRRHLESRDQVLVFLNRRGYAPALVCHGCGWAAACERCDARLTLHAGRNRLCCHHCGAERSIDPRCPACDGAELLRLGEGTERIEQALKAAFPGVSLVRVDRDTTRRKGALQDKLAGIERGAHQLLVGTQMLSKGHDFPNVTLAVILNIDQNLYSSDFRALERAAQLIVQVAGRAGRGERVGQVILQTHLPDHPLLEQLLRGGYEAFSRAALAERRLADLPPYRHMALIRAEAVRRNAPMGFLRRARAILSNSRKARVDLLGPAPAPMERRGGRYRAQLMLIGGQRSALQRMLQEGVPMLGKLPEAREVRFTIDVDPVDTL
jgi:primosomal protein N' (replication factor Y) (superfamily II helicase)